MKREILIYGFAHTYKNVFNQNESMVLRLKLHSVNDTECDKDVDRRWRGNGKKKEMKRTLCLTHGLGKDLT